jgi:hypothetical protein
VGKTLNVLITVIVITLINILLSKVLNIDFRELVFPVSLVITLIIKVFLTDYKTSSSTLDTSVKTVFGSKYSDSNYIKFYTSTTLYTCIVYTVISAIATIIIYWDYFAK